MKKALRVFIVTCLMWIVIGTSAQASIIAGVYSEAKGYTNFDGMISQESLIGGLFGLNDVAESSSDGGYWWYDNAVRTKTIVSNWSADPNDPNVLAVSYTNYLERSYGIFSLSGTLFGESPASTYTGSMTSSSNGTTFISRTDASSPWVTNNYVGTLIVSGSFLSDPYSFILFANLNFNESDITAIDSYGYRYLNARLSNVVLTITENPVPEPATFFLLGFGLLGVAGISRKKK